VEAVRAVRAAKGHRPCRRPDSDEHLMTTHLTIRTPEGKVVVDRWECSWCGDVNR
jgi:hypothetical protein